MYTTPTPVLVGGAVVTPVVGAIANEGLAPGAADAIAGTVVAPVTAPVIGPQVVAPVADAGTAAGTAPQVGDAGTVLVGEDAAVLGVRITRGDNPLVDNPVVDNPFVDTVQALANGSLPMTGLNVLFAVLTAITLVLMGLALVRIGRNLLPERA